MFTQQISDTSALPIMLLGVGHIVVGLLLFVLLLLRKLSKWSGGIPTVTLLLGGTLLIALSWTFYTLHVSVDDRNLTVGFGLLSQNEQIPLENIGSCQVTSYDWHDYGYGVHLMRPKGKMYNVIGDGGIATDLRLKDEPYLRLLFSSPDPKAVCDALKEQRPQIKEA